MVALALRENVRVVERAARGASQLSKVTAAMGYIARVVEFEWGGLDEPDRAVLRALAHMMTEPPRLGIVAKIRLGVRSVAWVLRNDGAEIKEFFDAGDRLKLLLLDVVEREHPGYDAFVSRGVSDAIGGKHVKVDADKFGDWLSSVRDSAY